MARESGRHCQDCRENIRHAEARIKPSGRAETPRERSASPAGRSPCTEKELPKSFAYTAHAFARHTMPCPLSDARLPGSPPLPMSPHHLPCGGYNNRQTLSPYVHRWSRGGSSLGLHDLSGHFTDSHGDWSIRRAPPFHLLIQPLLAARWQSLRSSCRRHHRPECLTPGELWNSLPCFEDVEQHLAGLRVFPAFHYSA